MGFRQQAEPWFVAVTLLWVGCGLVESSSVVVGRDVGQGGAGTEAAGSPGEAGAENVAGGESADKGGNGGGGNATGGVTAEAGHGTSTGDESAGADGTPGPSPCVEGPCELPECERVLLLGDAPVALGQAASGLVVGDWNGDGRDDVAAANAEANSVSVLLGLGNGTFTERVDYPAGEMSGAIAKGDWNGDGIADIALANTDANTVSVLFANGNGTFAGRVDYETGARPLAIAGGDFDDDGRDDLAVAAQGENAVSVLLATSDGELGPRVDYPTGAGPHSVEAGDVNGDSVLDLVTSNAADLSVLFGNGAGSFAERLDQPFAPVLMTAGDLNGDGYLDLGTGDPGGRGFNGSVNARFGAGDGTFPSSLGLVTTDASSIVTGDLSGNGALGVVAAATYGVTVLSGKGGGAFAEPVSYPWWASTLELGDLNCDQVPDIVAVTGDQISGYSLSALLGDGDGTFAQSQRNLNPLQAKLLAVKGPNDDGELDIVTADDEVSILRGTPGGTFASAKTFWTMGLSVALDVGDVDDDGRVDVLIANGNDQGLSVLFSEGAAPDGAGVYARMDYARGQDVSVLEVGDVDGDGDLDLVVASGSEVRVSLGFGVGNRTTTYDAGATVQRLALADVDGGGTPDIVTGNFAGTIRVLPGAGDGSFGTPRVSETAHASFFDTFADLNGDGHVDLVATAPNSLEARVSLLFGTEDATFVEGPTYLTPGTPAAAALGDLEGDGEYDLAISTVQGLSVFRGAGDGTFLCAEAHDAPPSTASNLVLADVNRDSRLDVVLAASDGVNVLLNQPNVPSACASALAVPPPSRQRKAAGSLRPRF